MTPTYLQSAAYTIGSGMALVALVCLALWLILGHFNDGEGE